MNETKLIEIYSSESKCCGIAKEEIISAFPESDTYYAERDWYIACEFLERFTDENGICKLDLDAVLDGNALDYCKNIAVFMIYTALMKSGRMGSLPPQVSMRAIPYISARMAIADIKADKLRKLDILVRKADRELVSGLSVDNSIDNVFDRILAYLPSARSFSSVSEPDKTRYLPFFEELYEKSQMCSAPYYEEAVGKYIGALK